MATEFGEETIGERLTRLRADLARVRTAVARAEEAGQSASYSGAGFTSVQYDQLLKRQTRLEGEIRTLEIRLQGLTSSAPGIAQIKTVMN